MGGYAHASAIRESSHWPRRENTGLQAPYASLIPAARTWHRARIGRRMAIRFASTGHRIGARKQIPLDATESFSSS
eukprot:2275529-Rhodomonas_salina.1